MTMNKLFFKNSGFVGIGTTMPSFLLEVKNIKQIRKEKLEKLKKTSENEVVEK